MQENESNEPQNETSPPEQKTMLEQLNGLLEIQGNDGNWNHDNYMRGMYNGMEMMIAMMEQRQPVYKTKEEMPQPTEYPRIPEMTLENLRGPITVKSSDNYLLVVTDAKGVNHYWMPDGKYDGRCAPCDDNGTKDSPQPAESPS